MKRAKTWKQRDGSLIEISKMGDRHLLNSIAMVERHASALQRQIESLECPFTGEYAMASFEDEVEALLSGESMVEPESICPEYSALVEEQFKRGIRPTWRR